MYPVSAAYRRAMRKRIRDPAYVRLQFGIFDRTAPDDATIITPPTVLYADPLALNRENHIGVSYAAFEGNRIRLDGTQYLLPDKTDDWAVQGFVSDVFCGMDGVFDTPPVIRIVFGSLHSMAGLTLDFGDCVPAQITVRTYLASELQNTFVVTDLTSYYKGEFLLDDIDGLEISYDKMRAPYTRARLNDLRFGIGYTFGNAEIIELAEKHTASPLSLSLPTARLSFCLYNKAGKFSVEGKTTLIRFLSEGQTIELAYGQTLALEDNKIEWVPTHPWNLETWKVDGIKASFTAYGLFEKLSQSTYEASAFDMLHSSPYEMGKIEVEKILTDADCEVGYFLQKDVTRWRTPLPPSSHAESLQLLANSNIAAMYEGRDGTVSIKPPGAGIRLKSLEMGAKKTAAFSTIDLTAVSGAQYATLETDFCRLDGVQLMVPEDGQYVPNEWVWEAVADKNGHYPDGENAWFGYWGLDANGIEGTDNCAGSVTLTFGPGPLPPKILVSSRSKGCEWAPSVEYIPTNHIETFEFPVVPAYAWQVTLIGGVPGRRARLRTWKLNGLDITQDTYGEPQYELKPRLKDIHVTLPSIAYIRDPVSDDQRIQLYTGKLPTDGTWYRIDHDLAIDPILRVSDKTVIAESTHYGYVSYIKLTSSSIHDTDFSILSNYYNLTSTKRYLPSNPRGESFDWENPVLVPWADDAWPNFLGQIKKYYDSRVAINIETRGEPQYDVLDVIPLDDGTWGIIESIETRFAGGLRSKMTVRKERDSNVENA